jgi:hypothetical protein
MGGIGSADQRKGAEMYARVVRFTDIDRQRIEDTAGQIESGEGPPPGVSPHSIQVVVDGDQSTAVVILFFESEEDLQTRTRRSTRWTPQRRPAPAPRSIRARSRSTHRWAEAGMSAGAGP